ncbi:MAG: hypothetical protein EBZ95_13160, partial [Chitinophagia bacterium]|nr:hypothetical protein [Chitinophagia bacterium]
MKKIIQTSISIVGIVLCVLMFSFKGITQTQFTMSIASVSATANTIDVTLTVTATNPSPGIRFGGFSAGINFSTATINGGTISAAYVGGRSASLSGLPANAINVSTAGHIRLATASLSGAQGVDMPQGTSLTLGTYRISNTASWSSCSNANLWLQNVLATGKTNSGVLGYPYGAITPSTSYTTTNPASPAGLILSQTSASTFSALLNSVSNTVAAASLSPTLCINTALTNITHATTGATGIGSATGLPAGVTATWASNTITISGTPTASGTFNYSIPLTGGCGTEFATGTITVTTANTAAAASSSPTLCINTALTNITHATTGATGIGTASGLPSGVSAAWSGDIITISGIPSASGTFSYSIPLTGGCGSVAATGTITVTAANTAAAASSSPTLCINTANSGVSGANGLPAGVSATWAANTITISGTPSASGTFNYSIPLTGGCGTVVAIGTITVTAANIAATASSSPTLCINTALTNIIHATTGATGIGIGTSLPSGVTAAWASNTITISGTPNQSGTFNYSIPLTGGCGSVVASGTITVTSIPAPPIGLSCWQTTTFNTLTCSWIVSGTQATQPTLACYETLGSFNTITCAWDVIGTQPAQPTLACYETLGSFNTTTCAWDVIGTQPVPPTLACYETLGSFNTTTCAWDVIGTQP